jgi:squalene-associated FAD-dependent desaturase
MKPAKVYIVGAGLSGLSAAVALAARGVPVETIEAAGGAGGRCRSYYEPALDGVIDNGNHLILSGNWAVRDYLRVIGSDGNFVGPATTEVAFADLRTGERWTIRPNDGPIPWWIFSKMRRVPGTRALDYLRLAKLIRSGKGIGNGALAERLIRPFLLATLNTEPELAEENLIAAVLRETLAKGGGAYRPRIAHPTLASAFIDPAIAFVESRGGVFRFGQRLRGLVLNGSAVTELELPQTKLIVAENESVILAAPPWVAKSLLPAIVAPSEFRSILSGHFRIAPPAGAPPMLGLLGATVEWIFSFPDRISVTVSNADRLIERERDELAALLWRDVATACNLPAPLPPWQIVKEKRATFAATPAEESKRPGARTRWENLFLAGDWTATGLPATIEGAVRSGRVAAELALARNVV